MQYRIFTFKCLLECSIGWSFVYNCCFLFYVCCYLCWCWGGVNPNCLFSFHWINGSWANLKVELKRRDVFVCLFVSFKPLKDLRTFLQQFIPKSSFLFKIHHLKCSIKLFDLCNHRPFFVVRTSKQWWQIPTPILNHRLPTECLAFFFNAFTINYINALFWLNDFWSWRILTRTQRANLKTLRFKKR